MVDWNPHWFTLWRAKNWEKLESIFQRKFIYGWLGLIENCNVYNEWNWWISAMKPILFCISTTGDIIWHFISFYFFWIFVSSNWLPPNRKFTIFSPRNLSSIFLWFLPYESKLLVILVIINSETVLFISHIRSATVRSGEDCSFLN